MEYKSKFLKEMKQQGNVSAASGQSDYKSKFFQSGNHRRYNVQADGKVATPAPMRTATDQTFPKETEPAIPQSPFFLAPSAVLDRVNGNQTNTALPDADMVAGSAADMNRYATEVKGAEFKLQQAEKDLQAVKQKETALQSQIKKIEAAQRGMNILAEEYQTTGSDVTYQAYMIAQDEYNRLLVAYEKDYAQYQKDAKAYDVYNNAVVNYQKKYSEFEKVGQKFNQNQEKYLAAHPEVKYADASIEEIEERLAQLRASNRTLSAAWKQTGAPYSVYGAEKEKIGNELQALENLLVDKKSIVAQSPDKIWGSSAMNFLDRIDLALQAGMVDWEAGMAQLDHKATSAVVNLAGSFMKAVGAITGSEKVKEKAAELLDQSRQESERVQDYVQISRGLMADALYGAGMIDGWIIQQMESVGAMMMDIYMTGGATQLGGQMMTAGVPIPGLEKTIGGTYAMTTKTVGGGLALTTTKTMALRAAGSGMIEAEEKGYSLSEQILYGMATGSLEYASERMFGGNPIYDEESGWLTDAMEKVIKNPKVMKLMYSKGFDIFCEGFEEVFVSIAQPITESAITWTNPEMPTAEELADAFAGGVFLSAIGQGASVVVNEVSGSGRTIRKAGRIITEAEAVQELVSEGLAADPNTEAYDMAQKLQKKLDAGKMPTASEIGRQMFANQDAIDRGLLVDDEMEPDRSAPEGTLHDPESGFYAIEMIENADGKTVYQIVQINEDGTIQRLSEQVDDLLTVKWMAESKGLNIRNMGSMDVLRDTAEEAERTAAMEEAKQTAAVEEPEQTTETPVVQEVEVIQEEPGLQWAGDEVQAIAENVAEPMEQAAETEKPGLMWAGDENMEGAVINETAKQEYMGTGADQKRQRGNETQRSAKSEKSRRAADAQRRVQEGSRIRSAAARQNLPRQSLKNLGLSIAVDSKSVRVLPRNLDPVVTEAYELAENAGLELIPVSGNILVMVDGEEIRVNAVIENGVIYAQADSMKQGLLESVKHEVFHDRAEKDPQLVGRLIDYLYDQYGEAEITRRFSQYYDDYQEIYSNRASGDKLREMIFEELLADAYAEYSRYGEEALTGLSEEVQEQAWAGEEKTTDRTEGGVKLSYVGERAVTADMERLRQAREMQRRGADNESIRKETGWFRGMDGKWRFEIDDSQMQYHSAGDAQFRKDHPDYARHQELMAKMLNGVISEGEAQKLQELNAIWGREFGRLKERVDRGNAILEQVLDHPALFEAYPQLKNTKIVFGELEPGTNGSFSERNNQIVLAESLRNAPDDTLLHEIQHAIQSVEGFSSGASREYWERQMTSGRRIHSAGTNRVLNELVAFEANPENEAVMRFRDRLETALKLDDNMETHDSIWEEAENAGLGDRLNQYFDLVFEYETQKNRPGNQVPSDLYRNTAGEIEARDTASRRKLNAQQRAETMPDYGNDDTVFADTGYMASSNEGKSIREQLRTYQDELNGMNPVANVVGRSFKDEAPGTLRKQIVEKLRSTGFVVDRLGFGEIIFDEKRLNSSLNYLDNDADAIAYQAIPQVLKRGKEFGGHDNHKDRNYSTVTIAAPVVINGKRGNMAIVVKRTGKNYYKMHRVLTPDGKVLDISEKEMQSLHPAGGVAVYSSLATPISSASTNSIEADDAVVNTRFSTASEGAEKMTSEDRARQRAEREIARGIGEIMSMPSGAVRELQAGLVRDLMEEYQETGDLNEERLQQITSEAFARGLVINNEFFDTYKPVKDYLRTMAVTISERDQADIPDFALFKKRAFGTLRITKNGGTPVDVVYQQLQEMAPGLFPDIAHPADQLMKMYEVAREIRRVEVPLERAMGEESDQFYEWAEGRIERLLDRVLTKYAESVKWKPQRKTETVNAKPVGTNIENPDYIQPSDGLQFGQQMVGNYYPAREPEPENPDYIQPEESGLEWAGQYQVGNWEPDFVPNTEEELSEEERARRGSMRDWIKYVFSGKLTPEEFAEQMKAAAPKKPTGAAAKLIEDMEARNRQGDGVNLYRDPEMSEEEYQVLNEAWKNRTIRQKQKPISEMTAEELIVPKTAFKSTPAMDKLEVKIDGSVTRYRETAQLRGYNDAAEKAQRALNNRLKKLKVDEREMNLAKQIAKGNIAAEDLNSDNVNIDVVLEVADFLAAIESFNDDRLYQRRAEINTANMRIAKELFQDSDVYDPKLHGLLEPMTKLVMNERTPERVVKQIFGVEQGQKIYDTYFRPVWVNGAEMYRFENRMKARIAEFVDKDGTTRKLTEQERAMAQRLLEGEAVRNRMEELTQIDPDMAERVKDAAQNVNNGVEWLDAIREHQIDEDHLGLVQAYADYMDTVTMSRDMDGVILDNAMEEYKKIYNELYEAMNDFLVSHGYKPIGFIKGYAPHFQKHEVQQGLFGALRALGVENEKVSSLPASIAGRTADFKPNMRWNPHMQSRTGEKTDYDIQLGFEQYLHYAAEMFYHTDDVMRVRQAVNWMRSQYSGENIKQAIEDAEVDQYKTPEWKREFLIRKGVILPQNKNSDTVAEINQKFAKYVEDLFEAAKPENLQKYSEFVTWLDHYANIVAGKQSLADRGIEYGGGREALNWGNRLMRTFAAANVAGNVSSVLNQSAQLPLIQQQLGKYMEHAVIDLVRGTAAKEHFAERSDFLTDKRGVEKLTMGNGEKIVSALFKPAEMMDRLVSTLAVRGRYLQAIDQGMTPEQAMKEADDFGRRVMGSRMKGARPLGFESKIFRHQMIHIFQTEASNTFDYMLLSDVPQAVKQVYKTKGKKAGARYVASAVMGYLINAFLLNVLTDELYGGSPAPFDLIGWLLNFVASGWQKDDEEYLKTVVDNGWEKAFGSRPFETEPVDREEGFQWADATEDLGYAVLGDVPYVRNAMGVMGWGDQSMPTVGIDEFFGHLANAGKALVEDEEKGLTWAGAAEAGVELFNAGTLLIPGGRQLQKMLQGSLAMAQGGKISGYGENARLQYPVERNAWNWLRAGLFGLSALDETDAFYAGGQALSAGQTQKVRELEKVGVDRFTTYNLYQEFREINKDLTGAEASAAKRNAINNLDLTDQQKLLVFDALTLDKTASNYEKTLGLYQAMLDSGLSWDDVTQAHNTYAMLNEDEELKASEKATEFAVWVDEQGWNEEQKAVVEERFKYWNMMPAESGNYNRFEEAGLETEAAKQATDILGELAPENGKEVVTTNQKVLALQNSNLPAPDKVNAIVALDPDKRNRLMEAGVPSTAANKIASEIMIAEAENGEDDLSYLEKARIVTDNAGSDDAAMDALSTVLNKNTYTKLEVAAVYGLRPKNWVEFKEEWQDMYGEDSVSQEKVKSVLDRMNLTIQQRAILWQIANKSWKPKNNPYNADVANAIYELLN